MCPKHGTDYLEYKCRYCCSVAVFFCFGTTHFCNPCHDDFQRVANIPKSELPQCPVAPKVTNISEENMCKSPLFLFFRPLLLRAVSVLFTSSIRRLERSLPWGVESAGMPTHSSDLCVFIFCDLNL